MADFISVNNQKSVGNESGESDGCSFSLIDILGRKLLDRGRLVTWSIVMVENPIIGSKFRPFSTHGTFFFV
jgi:hypothetical protein